MIVKTIKFAFGAAAIAGTIALGVSSASAVTFAEIGDAGETLSTAQIVGAGIDAITGSIDPGSANADLYSFVWGGGLFSATTETNPGTLLDTNLFLFYATGLGNVANGDSMSPPAPLGSLLSTIDPFNLAAGSYFLGISELGNDPVSAGGKIFGGGIQAPPTGPGGSQPLTGFNGTNGAGGTYRITLSGSTYGPAVPPAPPAPSGVPEPFTIIGTLIGGTAAFRMRNKLNSKIEDSVKRSH